MPVREFAVAGQTLKKGAVPVTGTAPIVFIKSLYFYILAALYSML